MHRNAILVVPDSVEKLNFSNEYTGQVIFTDNSKAKMIAYGDVVTEEYTVLNVPKANEVLAIGECEGSVLVEGKGGGRVMRVASVQGRCEIKWMNELEVLIIGSLKAPKSEVIIRNGENVTFLQIEDTVYEGKRLRDAKSGRKPIKSFNVRFL